MPSDPVPTQSWSDTPSGVGLKACALCDSPTQSHACNLEENEDGMLEPSNVEDADFILPVCHTCYEEVEGRADRVAFELNHARSPLLLEAGVTPKMLKEYADTSNMDESERYKAVGDKPVEDAVTDLEPGDVIRVNDSRECVIIPIRQEVLDDMSLNIECSFISVDGNSFSGGIAKRNGDYKFARVTQDSFEMDAIETIEYLGYNQEVADSAQ